MQKLLLSKNKFSNKKEYLQSKNKNIYVKDCKNTFFKKRVECLFVLESPSKTELNFKIPLCGDSGISVSKFLFHKDITTPFGLMVKRRNKIFKKCKIRFISIMNVSNVPLKLLDSFSNIPFVKQNTIIDDDVILKMFKPKFNKYLYNSKINIVVCGDIAKKYVKKCSVRNGCNIIYVPHPSRNQWGRKLKINKNLQALRKLFN